MWESGGTVGERVPQDVLGSRPALKMVPVKSCLETRPCQQELQHWRPLPETPQVRAAGAGTGEPCFKYPHGNLGCEDMRADSIPSLRSLTNVVE